MANKNYFIEHKDIELKWNIPSGKKKVRLDVMRLIFDLEKTFEDYLVAKECILGRYPHESVYEESFLEERLRRAGSARTIQATLFL
jgi:hypothetical protein